MPANSSDSFQARLVLGVGKSVEFHGPADITLATTDAIVNAANPSLMGGGGVDGAIHRAGGPSILEECKSYVARQGRLPAGQAMLTGGGRLRCKHVIHTVGPVYRGGRNQEAELLASCHREAIRIADETQLKSVSFPAISTGAYGYPLNEAAIIAVSTVVETLRSTGRLECVRFVLFDRNALQAYVRAAEIRAREDARCIFETSNEVTG
jgi:O-acetyl-ADP-ribose deacetylase